MTSSDDYLLGTSDQELRRLAYQHQVWLDETSALWRDAGFDRGQTLLDLGCGPGFATLDLAWLVGPDGRVFAVDASPKFIDHVDRLLAATGLDNVTTRIGDAQSMRLTAESLDGAFVRWVLCFLEDPESAIAAVADALKPGGTCVVVDYFNYSAVGLYPWRDKFEPLFRAYADSARAHGADYDVAGRVPLMMNRRGLEVVATRSICKAARPGSQLWHWLASFNDSYMPKLEQQGFLTREQIDTLRADFADLANDPSAFFFTPPVLAVIGRKR